MGSSIWQADPVVTFQVDRDRHVSDAPAITHAYRPFVARRLGIPRPQRDKARPKKTVVFRCVIVQCKNEYKISNKVGSRVWEARLCHVATPPKL